MSALSSRLMAAGYEGAKDAKSSTMLLRPQTKPPLRKSKSFAIESAGLVYGFRLLLLSITSFVVIIWVVRSLSQTREWTAADVERFLASPHPRLGWSHLPWPFLPNLNLSEHDPRILPALWLNWVVSGIESKRALDPELAIPFRWNSLLDLTSTVNDVHKSVSGAADCAELSRVLRIEQPLSFVCKEIVSPSVFPNVKIELFIEGKLLESARRFVGANYLMYSAPSPQRAILLGVGPIPQERSRDGNAFTSVVLKVAPQASLWHKTDVSLLVDKYQGMYNGADTISVLEQIAKVRNMWFASDSETSFRDDFQLPFDVFRFDRSHEPDELSLAAKDFSLHPTLLMKYFRSRARSQANSNRMDRVLSQNVHSVMALNATEKYFHEAELEGSSSGSHFDWRFFRRSTYSDYEHKVILHRLTRAWLRFARSANLKTWLAHGTLLGWYWNGLNMPWDKDLDVQMTARSVLLLARNYNQSIVVDYTDNADVAGVHLYFIDVSPYFYNRTHGDGANVIDARFIDVETGMYVDITALAITSDYEVAQKTAKGRAAKDLHQVFDSEYGAHLKSMDKHKDQHFQTYEASLLERERELWMRGELYNCKNFHFFRHDELEPLVKTHFEGEVAYVPSDFEAILRREYSKGHVNQMYNGWVFRPQLGVWLPQTVCRKDYNGDRCTDANALMEERHTRPIRVSRNNPLAYVDEKATRADPWLMSRNAMLET